jgi:hypothetical protein
MKITQFILLLLMTFSTQNNVVLKPPESSLEKRLQKSDKKPVYCLREKSDSSGTYYLYEKNFKTFCPK